MPGVLFLPGSLHNTPLRGERAVVLETGIGEMVSEVL